MIKTEKYFANNETCVYHFQENLKENISQTLMRNKSMDKRHIWKTVKSFLLNMVQYSKRIRLYSNFADRFCSEILMFCRDLSTQSEECSGMNYPHVIEVKQFKQSRNM